MKLYLNLIKSETIQGPPIAFNLKTKLLLPTYLMFWSINQLIVLRMRAHTLSHCSKPWKRSSLQMKIPNLSCHLAILCPICRLQLREVTGRQRLRPRPPVKSTALLFGLFSRVSPLSAWPIPLKHFGRVKGPELWHRCQPLLFSLHAFTPPQTPPLQDEEAQSQEPATVPGCKTIQMKRTCEKRKGLILQPTNTPTPSGVESAQVSRGRRSLVLDELSTKKRETTV